jgi:hypothetical protein
MSSGTNNSNSWWRSIWDSKSPLTYLLLFLFISVFGAYPFMGESMLNNALCAISFSLSFIAGIYSVTQNKNKRKIGIALSIALLIAHSLAITFTSITTEVVVFSTWIVYFLMLSFLLIDRIFSDDKVIFARFQGAIAVYIIFGIVFSFAFRILFLLDPTSIHFNHINTATTKVPAFEFLFFSFSTLTTLAYGEITPSTHLAQSLAIIEAVIGIMFTAILISRLVGLDSGKPNK